VGAAVLGAAEYGVNGAVAASAGAEDAAGADGALEYGVNGAVAASAGADGALGCAADGVKGAVAASADAGDEAAGAPLDGCNPPDGVESVGGGAPAP
jgi:hypothetical protein